MARHDSDTLCVEATEAVRGACTSAATLDSKLPPPADRDIFADQQLPSASKDGLLLGTCVGYRWLTVEASGPSTFHDGPHI
jgi:hypothetical protein